MFTKNELNLLLTKIKTLYVSHTSNKKIHMPEGGNSGQVLKRDSEGNAVWGDETQTTYEEATTSSSGLMSSTMVTKLNGIADGANKYSHPTTSGNKHIPSGGASGQILRWSADGTAVWGNDNDTTYSDATTSVHGLMSVVDKKALDILNKPLATCSTGRNTVAKVATLSNFVLQVGSTVAVKFTDTGTLNPTSGNLTLNVNGTGAKTIGYFRNGNKAALTYSVGSLFYNNLTHIFMYDGTYWLCMDWNADNNTTYSVATQSANGLMSAADKKKLDNISSEGSGSGIVYGAEPTTLTNGMTWIG